METRKLATRIMAVLNRGTFTSFICRVKTTWPLCSSLKSCIQPIIFLYYILFIGGVMGCSSNKTNHQPEKPQSDERFITRVVDPRNEDLRLFWLDENGDILNTFDRLKAFVESKQDSLLFAMNAGMFKKDFSPQGLFIDSGKLVAPLDTTHGEGNFYLQPNGVFYLTTDHIPGVCTTTDFVNHGKIKYATQSGPMLVIHGEIHPAFKQGSTHLNIRNGVGILPDNTVIFAMSTTEINLYDFALYFQRLGCKNALYLDGYVSRTYLPEKNWTQMDGHFGVMIGIVKHNS